VAAGALTAAIVTTAIVGASGAPTQSVLVQRLPASPVEVSAPSCSLASTGTASAIRVAGVCGGRLTGAFTCVERAKLLALSIDSPFGRRGQAFELTIVISDRVGSGRDSEAGAVAQVTGLGNVSRWSNRKLRVRVAPNGSVELSRSVLAPEPGTPATGELVLRGRAACA
jgi:hypothetical protein